METLPSGPDDVDEIPADLSGRSDRELVALLRNGVTGAYEQLWVRHIGAARRAAAQMTSTHADDLVSESFLSIYDQIYVSGRGPDTAFRAYLFAVMRNTAARWYREVKLVTLDPDADTITQRHGLTHVERQHDDAVMLRAFKALPRRWQRVLWLSDVETVSRSRIAAELGIRPNAVSALHRRARNGLREQWLLQHVPVPLRTDSDHVAAALPALLVRGAPAEADVASHLHTCTVCIAVERELRLAYQDGRSAAASVGSLAAVGVVLPGATTLWVTPVSVSIAAGAAFTLIGATSVLVGLLTWGIAPNLFAPPAQAQAEQRPALSEPPPSGTTVPPQPPSATVEAGDFREGRPPTAPPAGPPATDPGTELAEPIDIFLDDQETEGLPPRPTPLPPAPPGSTPPPDSSSPVAAPVMIVTAPSTYFAPALSGTAAPGADVAVRVDDDTYLTQASPEGEWDFDVRSLQLEAGEYDGAVWSIERGVSSAARSFSFVIEEIRVGGMPEYTPITLRDSLGDGLVFTVTAAPRGTVCLASDTGQSAMIRLDADGVATARLRFLAYGLYVLRLHACDGAYAGASTPRTISVVEGIFDPWIVDDEMVWELSFPDQETSTEPG